MTTINPSIEYLDLFSDVPEGSAKQITLRKIIYCVALVWVPPVLLSSNLLTDISFHVRCLLAIPILIAAETYVQLRVGDALPIIKERGYLKPEAEKKLSSFTLKIRSLRNSKIIYSILYLICLLVISRQLYIQTPGEQTSALATWWDRWISMSVYFFLLMKWFYRFILWCAFLVKFALLRPEVPSHHPDQVGGLSFILYRHIKFGFFVMSMSCVVSANIVHAVRNSELTIDSFLWPLVFYFLWIQLLLIAPLFVFTPLLVKSKREGLLKFAELGGIYGNLFEEKWSRKNIPRTEMLGSSDFQSLNDIGQSYSHLEHMKLFLMDRRCLLGFFVMTVTPLLPLLLFKIPLKSLLTILTNHFL